MTTNPEYNKKCCSSVCAFADSSVIGNLYKCTNQLSDHCGHVFADDHVVCDEYFTCDEGE